MSNSCDTIDYSPPGSSVPGIFQEWVAISISRASFWPRDQTYVCCIASSLLHCWWILSPSHCLVLWCAKSDIRRLMLISVVLPSGLVVKNLPANAGDTGDAGCISGFGRWPEGRNGDALHFLAWKISRKFPSLENFHGQRSLAGYSPWGHKELDITEWLSTHT